MNWLAKACRLTSVPLFAAAIFLTTSCEDPNGIGVELPGTAPVSTKFIDLAASASTVLQDSLQTLKADHLLVGRIRDNSLGTTVAKGILNVTTTSPLGEVLGDSIPAKFTSPALDSMVILMSFDQVYGNSTQPAHFDLFNLQQRLDERAVYNSSTQVPLGSAIGTDLVSSLTRTRNQRVKLAAGGATDTSTVVTAVADRTVRLVLHKPGQPSGFASTLFDRLKDASFSQAQLDAVWKGLAIAPSSAMTGTVVAFSRSPSTKAAVYFHDAVGKRHTYPIYFGTSSPAGDANAARFFTQISPDLSAAGPFARLTDYSKEVPATESNGVTYIQEGVGLSTKLVIPGLENLRNQPGLAINRAELIIPVKPYTNLLFPNPGKAYLYEANGRNRVLQRLVGTTLVKRLVQADGEDQKGQRAHSGTQAGSEATVVYYDLGPNNKYYSVVITSYVQAYLYNQLGGDLPASLLLSSNLDVPTSIESSLPLTLNRAVLDAGNIKLRVYYSNLQ